MSVRDLTDLSFFKKRRDVYLYKGSLNGKAVILKCASSKNTALYEAFRDEYKVLCALSHPAIPAYYWLEDSFSLPEIPEKASGSANMALCMEDCSHKKGYRIRLDPGESELVSSGTDSGLKLSDLNLKELLSLLDGLCDILSWLLDQGVLYTDLNPSNLILSRDETSLYVCLVDYTFSYFFIENPYPSYSLRFSYDLSPALKGQQLLIQELGFLLADMLEGRKELRLPSGVYGLIESGTHPSGGLGLNDYQDMIRNTMASLG